jgi:excisionase family DNA binding protein
MTSTIIWTIPDKELLRADEVAEIFRVKPKTVYAWHDIGKLPGVKMGGKCLRFRRAVIIEIISKDSTA